ncbi:MAG: hypothetical protein ACYTXY_38175 [Nostoc sp.]
MSILEAIAKRCRQRQIALQVVALTTATVRVTVAPIVEPMFTLTLAPMAHPFKVIDGADN